MISGKRQISHLAHWLKINPADKPKIYAQVYATAEVSSFNYWAEIFLAAGIATFGLVLNSPAVIIGAMLISPLMGPIMATGLALAAGDMYLAVKALVNLLASIGAAVALSGFVVWLLPFHSVTSEILGRTSPNLLDLGVALFSGLAGSIAVGRSGGGNGVTTLPGVAIAVALMPPLCTVGFGLGSGANMRIMGGAGLLFLTNLVAIVASAFMVFLLIGMDSPEIRAEMAHSRSGEFFGRKFSEGRISRALANGGKLHWRIIVLVVLLGSVAIPLRTALMQVAGETTARAAVQEVIRGLVPQGALVSQQVEVGKQDIAVQLVTTKEIPDEQIRGAEKIIEQRAGRKAEISLSSIASQSEFSELMQRIATMPAPQPALPVEKSIEEIRADVSARVKTALDAAWPQSIPMQDFNLAIDPGKAVVNVNYQAAQDMDALSVSLIEKQLQGALNAPGLQLAVHRTPPPRTASRARGRNR